MKKLLLVIITIILSNLNANSNSYHPYKEAALIEEANLKISLLLKSLNEFNLKELFGVIETPFGNSKIFLYKTSKERIDSCIQIINKNAPYYNAVKSKIYNFNTVYSNDFFINSSYEDIKEEMGYPYYICKEVYNIKKFNPNIYATIKAQKKDNIIFDIRIDGKDIQVKFNKFANHIYFSDNNEALYEYIKLLK